MTLIRRNLILIILCILFAVGTVGHILPDFRNLMLSMTEWFLLGCNLVVISSVINENKDRNPAKFQLWILISFLVTFAAEVIGVATGLVFGNYSYGSVFGLQLWETPLLIGLNWVLVTLGAILVVQNVIKLIEKRNTKLIFGSRIKFIITCILAGLVAVVFDFVLEPVAIKLGYWNWEGGIIPLQNYITWFILTVFCTGLYQLLRIRMRSNLAQYYLLIQFIFFVLLQLFVKI